MKTIKKLSMILAAAFMVVGISMANEGREGKRSFDPKEHAEKMTERMVKEYDLNDIQKKQLLELNLSMTEKMGNHPMRHHHSKKGHMAKDNKENKENKDGKATRDNKEKRNKERAHGNRDRHQNHANAPRISAEEREKKHQEMKQVRENYNTELQKIMNTEQYQAFTKKQAEREQKRKDHGDKTKENRNKRSGSPKSGKQV